MASKGRLPPPHLRHPIPGPGIVHPDPYVSAIPQPLGGFPPFEMLPPHEVMEQKLSAQHIEIEKLATENRRLAATHGTLRQDLAGAKHELQLVHAHIAEVKSEKDQQMRGIVDKISVLEPELEAAETIKMELQQARGEAQKLAASRQELILKAQQLTHDLQKAHSEAQQIRPLMAELDNLRQEYQHFRATYDYEKKLYSDHLESLQLMEKNYMAMSSEVEKLRAELAKSANFDPRTGLYGGSAVFNENVPVGNYASGQNAYGAEQGQFPMVGGGSGNAGHHGAAGAGGNSSHAVVQSGPYGSGNPRDVSRVVPGYGATRGTGYDSFRAHAGASYDGQTVQHGPVYDVQRGSIASAHNPQMGAGYDAPIGSTASAHNPQIGGPGYEAQRGHRPDAHKGPVYGGQIAPAYDSQRGMGDEVQRRANYDPQKSAAYNPSSGSALGAQGQVPMNNVAYPSTAGPGAATGYHQPIPRGENPVRR